MCQCSWAAGGCAKPVPFFEGAPFHSASRPAYPSTRQTLDGLTATTSWSSIMKVSRR
jgi:hypothetical protein